MSWAPDIYNLEKVKGNHLLVTTSTANKLIADVWFARADFATHGLLGWHVIRRAKHLAGHRQFGVAFQTPGQSKVCYARLIAGVDREHEMQGDDPGVETRDDGDPAGQGVRDREA